MSDETHWPNDRVWITSEEITYMRAAFAAAADGQRPFPMSAEEALRLFPKALEAIEAARTRADELRQRCAALELRLLDETPEPPEGRSPALDDRLWFESMGQEVRIDGDVLAEMFSQATVEQRLRLAADLSRRCRTGLARHLVASVKADLDDAHQEQLDGFRRRLARKVEEK